MYFIILVLLTALGMEGIGSFISVIGFGALFSMNPIIMTMAVILDVAKIVSVSFLYQCWDQLGRWWKFTFIPAAIVLVMITSAGAFGYLTGEFQKALQPHQEVTLKVDSLKRERTAVLEERDLLRDEKSKIDVQISQLPENYVTARQRLIRSFSPDLDRIRDRTTSLTKRSDELTKEIFNAESENIEMTVHVGPILYVSKVFDITVEEASKWVIFMLILVFDPLAIMLVLAGNFLILQRRTSRAASSNTETKSQVMSKMANAFATAKTQEETSASEPPISEESTQSTDLTSKTEEEVKQEIASLLPLPTPEETEKVQELIEKLAGPEVTPAVDVVAENSYSGTEEAELIEEIPLSELERVTVRVPEALFGGVGPKTHSLRRYHYANLK